MQVLDLQRDRRTGDLRPSRPLLPTQTPPALRAAARSGDTAVQPDAEMPQVAEEAAALEATASQSAKPHRQACGGGGQSQALQDGSRLASQLRQAPVSPAAASPPLASVQPSVTQPLTRQPGSQECPSQTQAASQPGSQPQRTPQNGARQPPGSQPRRSQQPSSQARRSQPLASPSVIDLASDSDEEMTPSSFADAQLLPASPQPHIPSQAAGSPPSASAAARPAAQTLLLPAVELNAELEASAAAQAVPAAEAEEAAVASQEQRLPPADDVQGSQPAASAQANAAAPGGAGAGGAEAIDAAGAAGLNHAAAAVAEEAQEPGIWFEVGAANSASDPKNSFSYYYVLRDTLSSDVWPSDAPLQYQPLIARASLQLTAEVNSDSCWLTIEHQTIHRVLQVSAHTSRVHLHGAPDGSCPLGASLPLEALLPACQPSAAAATLLAAAEAR